MDYSVTLPIDLDVLDAHVSNELSGFANIFLEKLSYERVESARGRIVYHVHIQHLGDVGRIKLLKRGPGDTDLETYVVPAEREEWTEENRAAINSVENNLDQNKLIIELSNERDKAANDLTDRRHTILKDMVTGIIEGLYHRRILPFVSVQEGVGETWLTKEVGIVARGWGMQAGRVKRWRRIAQDYYPKGYTQLRISELEYLSLETIKADFRDMKARELLGILTP